MCHYDVKTPRAGTMTPSFASDVFGKVPVVGWWVANFNP